MQRSGQQSSKSGKVLKSEEMERKISAKNIKRQAVALLRNKRDAIDLVLQKTSEVNQEQVTNPEVKARELFLDAAILNDGGAMNYLGLMFQFGVGTKANPSVAYDFYKKASARGKTKADKNLKKMEETFASQEKLRQLNDIVSNEEFWKAERNIYGVKLIRETLKNPNYTNLEAAIRIWTIANNRYDLHSHYFADKLYVAITEGDAEKLAEVEKQMVHKLAELEIKRAQRLAEEKQQTFVNELKKLKQTIEPQLIESKRKDLVIEHEAIEKKDEIDNKMIDILTDIVSDRSFWDSRKDKKIIKNINKVLVKDEHISAKINEIASIASTSLKKFSNSTLFSRGLHEDTAILLKSIVTKDLEKLKSLELKVTTERNKKYVVSISSEEQTFRKDQTASGLGL